MPRKTFDLQPLTGHADESVEECNEHMRATAEIYEWAREAIGPCGCGMFVEGVLCLCSAQQRREMTPARVRQRLEAHYRYAHQKGLAAKRKFPDLPPCPMGTCFWCRQPIVHGRAKFRSMHDGREDEPECRHLYELHTRLEAQQSHLLSRDGRGCRGCGAVWGRFRPIWTDACEDRVAETWRTRAWIRERFAEQPAGPVTYIGWDTGLEVDHFVPLALAFVGFPDSARRRWFFSPANLKLLCRDCHAAKTVEDRRLIREANVLGEPWAKATILRMLSDARLIRTIARTEGGYREVLSDAG